MQLDQIQTVQNQRPGAKGTVQITANGAVNITPPAKGRAGYLIEDLHANIAALGLQMTGQPLGDVHLTADSQSGVLRTHLDSNFANSTIGGDGEWRLRAITRAAPRSHFPSSISLSCANGFRLPQRVGERSWQAPPRASCGSTAPRSSRKRFALNCAFRSFDDRSGGGRDNHAEQFRPHRGHYGKLHNHAGKRAPDGKSHGP